MTDVRFGAGLPSVRVRLASGDGPPAFVPDEAGLYEVVPVPAQPADPVPFRASDFDSFFARRTYETGGMKDNVGKPRLDLIPRAALEAMADAMANGAETYGVDNWKKGLPWRDTFASVQRHLWAWVDGEDLDPKSGKSHLGHALAQIAFLAHYAATETGTDDRRPEAVAR